MGSVIASPIRSTSSHSRCGSSSPPPYSASCTSSPESSCSSSRGLPSPTLRCACERPAGFGATLLGSVITGIVISVMSFAAFTVKAWWTLKPDQVSSPQPHIMEANQPASNVAVLGAAVAPAVGTLVLSPKGVTATDALTIGFAGGIVFIVFAFAFYRALKLARRGRIVECLCGLPCMYDVRRVC
ncbi:hypothetical protein C8Q76DRAFT_747517 [Earliella scabrosa]|nr:hypothetical protein C8Q76DRAFT_747517 [Earliella scabrosa]